MTYLAKIGELTLKGSNIKEFENLLTGKSLPIDRRSIGALMEETSLIFSDAFTASNASEMQKHSFFNLIEESLFLLTK